MENYYNHRLSFFPSFNTYSKFSENEVSSFYNKNNNCFRQQLILFCSTPFFEDYKKTNPELCEYIYNISSFMNYGIGNINDLKKPSNQPFSNILKVGVKEANNNIFNFLHSIEDDNDSSDNNDLNKNLFNIFKYNVDVCNFLFERMFFNEDYLNNLKKGHTELFQAYTNNLSPITKILCKVRNENVLYFKTNKIDLNTAIQYSEDIVNFTKLYSNKTTLYPSSSYSMYKEQLDKGLCLTQFLASKIENFNFKPIIKNTFNYKNSNTILKTDSLFFYSMMFFLLAPSKFSQSHLFSLKNMFEEDFDLKNNVYPEAINQSMNLISDYFVTINCKDPSVLNSTSKKLHELELEIQKHFDIDPIQKEKNVEKFFDDWTTNINFCIENPSAILRTAQLKIQLVDKPDIIKKRAKI